MAQQTFNNTKINVEFEESASRQQLNSGENISTLFGKIKKIFSDLKAVCFSGNYNDLENKPEIPTNSDITDIGNLVQLDGLQGGVPFAEISVSGDAIIGQELTVSMSGKNLLRYPFRFGTINVNGVVITDNADGTVTVDTAGSATTDDVIYYFALRTAENYYLDKGTYVLHGCPKNCDLRIDISYTDLNGERVNLAKDNGDGAVFEMPYRAAVSVELIIFADKIYDNIIVRPQIELGTVASDFEMYKGAEYTITPDNNPYVIPNDIRQQDGLNNISVSAGELSVTGVRKNAAVKSIWDRLDELTTAIIVANGEI